MIRRVREALPAHDLLFFADQAHVPYGERSPSELLQFMRANVAWLDERGVGAIIPACNTSCAMALKFGWPQTRAPIVDLIESAALAVERSGLRRIGVLATTATAATGAYRAHIERRVPHAAVVEIGAPALAPLVEAGKLHGDEPASAVAQACERLRDVDALVLGCTHYPLLWAHFEAYFGPYVHIIDPALVQAERVASLAAQTKIDPGTGRLECVTNGDLERFTANVDALMSDLNPVVRHLAPVNG